MLILVTSDNFILLFFGWEGVGLCSYLLINFWFTRLQANKSAIKAMLVNRMGDFGLAFGIFGIFSVFKTVDFIAIFSLVPYYLKYNIVIFNTHFNLITFICLFIFIGVVGKSAQLGLHTWLPDAMEGPTPVSALIHAATMVTAGVFLLIRCSPIYEFSSYSLFFIALLGSVTSFFSATIGVFQNDLKKVIAYSTCSQLGYMVFICGLSHYSVGMFHVLNHAYFKALLFLSAGSIIHSLSDEQDMRKMGGLHKLLPFSYTMFIVGSMSLMGMPFLTGYYSKDLILEITYSKYNLLGSFVYWLGIISASITSFYSFKLIYMTFLSKPNSYKTAIKLTYDAPYPMAIPLFLLSIGSIFVGYFTKDLFIGLGTPLWNNSIFILPTHFNFIDAEFIPTYIKFIPFVISIFGSITAILCYHIFSNNLFNTYVHNIFFNALYLFFNKKWFFDKLQNNIIVSFLLRFGYSITYKLIDKGLVEFLGPTSFSYYILQVSKKLILFQSGKINQYAFIIFLFFFLFASANFLFHFFILYINIQILFIFIFFVFNMV
jgi:NADH-ubiquinone oxidoreductase chain 5